MEEGLEDTPEKEMLRIFQPDPIDDIEFIWCLVGNIIGEHPYGELTWHKENAWVMLGSRNLFYMDKRANELRDKIVTGFNLAVK